MKMSLSSERETLASHLFLALEEEKSLFPLRKRVVLVPDGALAGWLLLYRAKLGMRADLGELVVLDSVVPNERSCSFHLFGFREFPLTFISEISKENLSWYFFSPCAHFWSDLLSEREIGKKVSQVKKNDRNSVQVALDSFYSEANSLLSNAAILGRQAASFLDDFPCEMKALYPVPRSLMDEESYRERLYDREIFMATDGKSSLLNRVQADLLFLMGARFQKHQIIHDESFLFIEAPTVRSEIAAVRNMIADLSSERPLAIGDVLILSPTPCKYKEVLSECMKGRNVKVQTLFEETSALSLKVQRWLSLIHGRFERKDLLSLLAMPELAHVLECDEEELSELKEKIRLLPISWGMDEDFKKRYIVYHGIEAQNEDIAKGTVKENQETIFRSLFEEPCSESQPHSLWVLSMRFFALLRELSSMWGTPLFDLSESTVQVWQEKMKKMCLLIERGFQGDEMLLLLEALASLELIEEKTSLQDFIARLIEKIDFLSQRKKRNLTGHVLLGSLLDTTPFPARMIILIGMDDENVRSFVREKALLAKEDRGLIRNRLHYAVLDSLMQAQEKYVVSYLSWDFETRQKKEPAQIVVFLSEYIDSQFLVEGNPLRKSIDCLEWVVPHDKKEMRNVASFSTRRKELALPLPMLLKALSDPLSYFMKTKYGHKGWSSSPSSPSLFATTRDLIYMVEKELLSPGRFLPKKHMKGISKKLIHKEFCEMKAHCQKHLEIHLKGRKLEKQSIFIYEGSFKGDIALFSPFADITIVEDPRKELSSLWPKWALLSSFENEISTLSIEPSVLFPYQGKKRRLPQCSSHKELEDFWQVLQETPFPFSSDALPTLIGKNASYFAFEEYVQEKIEEKNRLISCFALAHDAVERKNMYSHWQDVAEKLISPWYSWLQEDGE